MTEPSGRAINLENSWEELAPMHIARSDLGLAAINGKLYAIGGNTENGYVPNSEGNNYLAKGWITNANEEYDPENNSWTTKASMPTPRYAFAIATINDKIYCLGGIINWDSGAITYTAVNEVYDPSTDTWETKTPLPIAMSGEANVIENKIYVVGKGVNGTFNEVYDPSTDTWSTKAPMPNSTNSHPPNTLTTVCTVTFDNKIHILDYAGYLASHLVYDPSDDSWVSLSSSTPSILQQGNWWSQAAISTTGLFSTRQIYVFLARYTSPQHIPNYAYDPLTDKWVAASHVPTYRQNFAVAVLNDTIYAVGGRTYDYPELSDAIFTVAEKATNERYTPFGYGTPDPTAPIPSPTIPEHSFLSLLLLLLVIPLITFFFIKRNRSKGYI